MKESWVNYKDELQEYARIFDKSIVLHDKSGWFIRSLCWIIALGRPLQYKTYLTKFAQTIGNHHFYPGEWSREQVERVIPHEAQHTYQARICGFYIHPLVGLPIMAIVYGWLFLPMGLAIGRVWLELDADAAAWKQILLSDDPNAISIVNQRAVNFALTVAGRDYFYPLPTDWVWRLFRWKSQKLIKEIG